MNNDAKNGDYMHCISAVLGFSIPCSLVFQYLEQKIVENKEFKIIQILVSLTYKSGISEFKSGWGINQTYIRSQKVTDIYYNTVGPYHEYGLVNFNIP